MKLNERFQNNYDFLRVFAALCIIFYHSFGLLNASERELLSAATGGRINTSLLGLGIFFSISGFLIAKSASNSVSAINYLWKRFLRIQPLLVVLCVFTVFIIGPLYTSLSAAEYFGNLHTWTYFRNIFPVFGIQFSLPEVFSNLPHSGVNGSLWTLILEERLYIFVCLIFLFRKRNTKVFILIAVLLNILYLINLFFFTPSAIPYLNTAPFTYYLIFLNSSVLYFSALRVAEHPRIVFLTGLILLVIAITIPDVRFLQFYGFPLMVNGLAYFKGFLNRAGKYGDFTYGLYIFAFPIQNALISALEITNPYTLFSVTLLIVFPIAIFTWNAVEKRFLRMKHLIK